jgi:hypothetical protein
MIKPRKLLPFSLLTAISLLCSNASGAVSYLLVQGPFDPSNAVMTFQWKVIYDTGSITTGLDLLKKVFGNPVANGTYDDNFGGTYNYFKSGNSTTGAAFMDFGGGSLFTESITLSGKKVAMDPGYDPGWNYYAAGGTGSNHAGGTYDPSSWAYSDDGITTRSVADGSYDGWVYGGTFPAATIVGSLFTPTAAHFAGSTVINLSIAPEPGRPMLLLVGLTGLILQRRKPTRVG